MNWTRREAGKCKVLDDSWFASGLLAGSPDWASERHRSLPSAFQIGRFLGDALWPTWTCCSLSRADGHCVERSAEEHLPPHPTGRTGGECQEMPAVQISGAIIGVCDGRGSNPTTGWKGRSCSVLPNTYHQFCGLVGWYRRLVPNFADRVEPLTSLTGKSCPGQVKWTLACEATFEDL